ncbi:hypothetical protein KM1_111260 [Entamoeba histolytica HM-3:IMSS]|uniref:Uncharacterized protein n=1 Tax=Entamoeba histolytica HM-3:IMSS TaxID=885315 RepID=M7WLY4_ENTHI|nr:hypothetical protein KM1_111260 [Entamoeba histolytica HM-3:IMSS]
MTEVVRPFALPCITFKKFVYFESNLTKRLRLNMSKLNQRRMKIESDNEKIKEPPVECEIHF